MAHSFRDFPGDSQNSLIDDDPPAFWARNFRKALSFGAPSSKSKIFSYRGHVQVKKGEFFLLPLTNPGTNVPDFRVLIADSPIQRSQSPPSATTYPINPPPQKTCGFSENAFDNYFYVFRDCLSSSLTFLWEREGGRVRPFFSRVDGSLKTKAEIKKDGAGGKRKRFYL